METFSVRNFRTLYSCVSLENSVYFFRPQRGILCFIKARLFILLLLCILLLLFAIRIRCSIEEFLLFIEMEIFDCLSISGVSLRNSLFIEEAFL